MNCLAAIGLAGVWTSRRRDREDGSRLIRLTTLAALALALAASGCAGSYQEARKPPRPQDYEFVSQGRSFGPPGG